MHITQDTIIDLCVQAFVEGRLRASLTPGRVCEAGDVMPRLILQAQVSDGTYVTVCTTHPRMDPIEAFSSLQNGDVILLPHQ